jgi:hypothetical protein
MVKVILSIFVLKRENKREKKNVLPNKTNDFQKHKKEIA